MLCRRESERVGQCVKHAPGAGSVISWWAEQEAIRVIRRAQLSLSEQFCSVKGPLKSIK